MEFINNLLCLAFYVLIFIFDSVNNPKAEKVPPVYLFTKNLTWVDATAKCQMVGLEKTVNISSPYSGLSWINVTAAYSTWVEYLGCFDVLQKQIAGSETMTHGTTLLACIESCKQYFFIGLQDKLCVCLYNISLDRGSVKEYCSVGISKICLNDDRAFCASVDSYPETQHLTVYKKVNINTGPRGECLFVQRILTEPNYIRYEALNCLTENFPICLHSIYGNDFDSKNKTKKNWIESFALCDDRRLNLLARFSQILIAPSSHVLDVNTKYWVSNTRRLIEQFPPVTNPEVCIAARVKQDGLLKRFPIRCDKQLPGLCVGHEVTPTYVSSENTQIMGIFSSQDPRDTTVAITDVSQYPGKIPDNGSNEKKIKSSDDATPINKVLIISVIAATSLTILVAIVIVVLCIRMKKQQSNASQNQINVDGKNDVYAQVDRPMNQDRTIDQSIGQSPVEDTYDHMDHRCLSQRPPQEESNYDMMSNIAIIEENDYSHTNETVRERQCFVDASSEYSHVTMVAKPETRD